jgi:hypothetical protein
LKKHLNYIIGILLILIGLILKTFLNHNVEYWEFVKYSTIFLFLFGILFLFYSVWNKMLIKPTMPFFRLPVNWIFYYLKNAFFLVASLAAIVGLEKSGELLNYELRRIYLSQETIKTEGVITNYLKIDLVKAGEETFYLISFKCEDEIIQKGLIIDYSKKDNNYQNKMFTLTDNVLKINRLKGSKVKIVYSKYYPSFLKIVE